MNANEIEYKINRELNEWSFINPRPWSDLRVWSKHTAWWTRYWLKMTRKHVNSIG